MQNSKSHIVRKRTGFTLIELLVVIAIIAILAAILFPVFARARENARRASCQSNLKQMGLGIFQYTQDYDEKMPLMFHYVNGTSSPLYWWIDTLQPYVRSYQIFVCPSHTITGASGQYAHNRALAGYTYPTGFPTTLNFSYATNAVTNPPAGSQDGPFDTTTTSLAAIEDVATTLMVFDVSGHTQEISAWGRVDITNASDGVCATNTDGGNCLSRRHLEGTNYLFFDGHVKWLKQSQPNMWSSKSD